MLLWGRLGARWEFALSQYRVAGGGTSRGALLFRWRGGYLVSPSFDATLHRNLYQGVGHGQSAIHAAGRGQSPYRGLNGDWLASLGTGGGRSTAGEGEGAVPSEGPADGSVAPARSSISAMTQVPNLARDRASSWAGAVANPAATSRQKAEGSAATMSMSQDASPRTTTSAQARTRTLLHIQHPPFHSWL